MLLTYMQTWWATALPITVTACGTSVAFVHAWVFVAGSNAYYASDQAVDKPIRAPRGCVSYSWLGY